MSAGADSVKSILFALGANFLIALAKTGGAIFTGSSSMLAEAIHSYADCANQGLLLWGMREGRRRPSLDHPLGHGKAIYFWSFIVALMLFSMGGLFSIYEGVHKLQAPEPVTNAWVAIAILVFGIAAESVSLWGCLREVNKDRGDQGLWRWFRTSRQSELLVVFAEDIAALGGLVLALVFISLAHVTGNPAWDAAGSICIGVLLVLVAAAGRRPGEGAPDRSERRGPRPRADARAPRLARRSGDCLQHADATARPGRDGRGQGEDATGGLGAGAGRVDQSRRTGLSSCVPAGAVAVLRARPRRLSGGTFVA
jgi:cation diffusion facilitator family transporter